MSIKVHNHGPTEGLECSETQLADGSPIGWCQVAPITQQAKQDAWEEGRKAHGYIFGHYHDCTGWDDCYCTTYINPYKSITIIEGFCGNHDTHAAHKMPQRGMPSDDWRYLPAYACGGFHQCERCYGATYDVPLMPYVHVCESGEVLS